MARIALILGHPTADHRHLCAALAVAYSAGAQTAGHEVKIIDVAQLDFAILRSRSEWEGDEITSDIRTSQHTIEWADHLVLIFPLWLGTMPALLKGFLEQVFRPGFGAGRTKGRAPSKALFGRTARCIVTMGMPALIYRWYFGAHGVRGLERGILSFVGIRPRRRVLIGSVENLSERRRQRLFRRVRRFGANAA